MLELLGNGPLSASALADQFALSAPAVSQHLKALREAGLVRVRIDAQRRIYSLDPEGLAAVDEWIGKVRAEWQRRLDALEGALLEEKKQ